MSKGSGWVAIDKNLAITLSKIDRQFTILEAMFSFSVDVNNGKEWTIKGYAKQWNWSRNKVRKFVEECRTQTGHKPDTKGTQTGHPVFFIDKDLWREPDTKRTQRGHKEDTKPTPTNNPNNNPNPKKEKDTRFNARVYLSENGVDEQHISDWLKIRSVKKLPATKTAINNISSQAKKCNLTLPKVIEICCQEGWAGFKAEWTDKIKQEKSWI